MKAKADERSVLDAATTLRVAQHLERACLELAEAVRLAGSLKAQPALPSARRKAADKITLGEWAARLYDPPPSAWVLGKWRREGQIYPPPERVGRKWFVRPDARRTTEDALPYGSLVDRLKGSEGRR